MDISVVSGTYNRLPYLQAFVESIRQSILPCLSYEIVLVDGGSRDGTIEWCRTQTDIALIEHGELRGAVAAFNDGFAAAQGEFLIAGNDDVVFLDRSITRAWVHMAENPAVGQGCFYQKRGRRRDWHVEPMMALDSDGRQVTVPYGQVAMVPKWLGDELGWWGDNTHTYGGDNELSCNIWEAGYRVEPVPGARIIDQAAPDELRAINQGTPEEMARRGQMHPDTRKFYEKWPKGPTIGEKPRWGPRLYGPRRILYAPIIETGYSIQKEQKTGLSAALVALGRIVEWDYQGIAAEIGKETMEERLLKLVEDWQPHVALIQVHYPHLITADTIGGLRLAAPDCQIINWNGDYHPEQMLDQPAQALIQAVDVQAVVCADWISDILRLGTSAAYWQIGWEPAGVGHEPNGGTPHHDILFLANCYTSERERLGAELRRISQQVGATLGIYGMGWPAGWSQGQNLYDFVEGCRLMRASRVIIGDQQWPDAEGYVSNRIFQTLAASGGVFLQERFKGMTEWLGLQEGEHLLCWSDFSELSEGIAWALGHPEEARRIAERGEAYVKEHHSFEARVTELEHIILAKGG